MADDPHISAAYVAGLFDGEGCVATRHRRRAFAVYARLSMTDPRAMLAIAHEFGGKVSPCKRDRRGKRTRQCWHWDLFGAKAKVFFETILPYCVVKKDEVALAITLLSMERRRDEPHGTAKLPPSVRRLRADLAGQIKGLKRREFKVGG